MAGSPDARRAAADKLRITGDQDRIAEFLGSFGARTSAAAAG